MSTVKCKIKKGDEVVVISGSQKGVKGSVLKVLRKAGKVLVAGVNVKTRHTKQTAKQAGGIVKSEAPISISNVAVVDPKSDSASKVGIKTLEDGQRVRFAKKSGEVLDS